MNPRTQRFLPDKIKSGQYVPRTRPEQFEDAIREAFDFSRKISRKSSFDQGEERFIRQTYQGQIEKRRKAALRTSLRDILRRNTAMDPEEAAVAWIELNAPLASYTEMEQKSHVLFAAAIWMLDRITEQPGWRKELFRLLPRDERETEEFFEPDVWDCCYEYDLIASVISVLYYRNLNVNRKNAIDTSKFETFEERLQLSEDNPHVLTSEYAAAHALPDDWRSAAEPDGNREQFRALLALIPQEKIDEITEQFRDLLQKWVDRFFEGIAEFIREHEELDRKKTSIAKEHNALIDELGVLIESVDEKRRSRTVRKDQGSKGAPAKATPPVNPLLANPAGENPLPSGTLGGGLPGFEDFMKSQSLGQSGGIGRNGAGRSAFGMFGGSISGSPVNQGTDAQMDRINGLYQRILNLENRFSEIHDKANDVYRRERSFTLRMSSYGRISKTYSEQEKSLPASLLEPMRLPDAYGLCFALLYLIETGDDLPWLYGACCGFMMEVCESLPWGMMEYDEIEDPIWGSPNEQADVPKTAAIPDLNERKYASKDSDYYFPRSFAQILYEETGCILPRDDKIYYPEYETFRQYGLRGRDAGFMMLLCAVLGTARRNVKANNFNPEFLRIMEEDLLKEDETPETDREDEGAHAEDGDAEAGGEAHEQLSPPKDEKDILIDQLKEALKKSKTALHSAEVESRNMRKELGSIRSIYEREHREVADLREIVFNAQFAEGTADPEQAAEAPAETYPYETARRTTVFGGHDTFLKAIKPMLPNVRFIDSNYMTFSPELVRNSDIVWIQSNCISHPMFWNVVKYAKQYGVQLRYFGFASAEKCANQVVEADKRQMTD